MEGDIIYFSESVCFFVVVFFIYFFCQIVYTRLLCNFFVVLINIFSFLLGVFKFA